MPSINLLVNSHAIDHVNGVPVGKIVYLTANATNVPDDKWFVVELNGGINRLICVASAADFTNLPIVAPSIDNPLRWWRSNTATYVTDNPQEMAEQIETTKRRFQATIDALKVLAETPASESFTFN